MHPEAFEYLRPTPRQLEAMTKLREAAKSYAEIVEDLVPPGADKDHVLRSIRSASMWANVAITRYADGAPRS